MQRIWCSILLLVAALSGPLRGAEDVNPAPSARPTVEAAPAPAAAADPARITRVIVIPVRDQIADPILYIIRRGLKSAAKDDLVLLDMETPGGSVATMLEIAEALGKFEGRKATYVNDEAISAGALIASVTDDIYFAPKAVMGAAAVVSAGGEEIQKTMKEKVDSFLLAKVRAWVEGKGRYRADALTAMVDSEFEFKIGDTVIKPKGKLLSVTASEAARTYGEPAEPLLSAGTYGSIDELLAARLGPGRYRIEKLEVTWSEQVAQYLTNFSPVLLGLGLLLVFIEFKTPGFGAFGIIGGALLLLVFFGSYIAGLSGHEPAVVFVLGLLLVLVELFFFPGTVVVALTGVVLMLGSLVWAMADLWPNEPLRMSGDAFVKPLMDLGLGLGVAVALGLLLSRFIPKGWFFERLAVAEPVAGSAQLAGVAPEIGARAGSLVGARGVAVTGLLPAGQIEIDGHRYEARLEVGSATPGTPVVVRKASDFLLIVEVDRP